jgi:hypothetical protein
MERAMSIYLLVLTTLAGMGHMPAPAMPVRAHFASLEACEAAATLIPMDAAHRLICMPVEVARLEEDCAV